MRIQLRFYGVVADLIQPSVNALDLHEGASVGDVIDRLTGANQDNAAVLRQVTVFVDDKQADRSTVLQNDATVIFMRPIGGGASDPHPAPESGR